MEEFWSVLRKDEEMEEKSRLPFCETDWSLDTEEQSRVPQLTFFCTQCGTQLTPGAHFCQKCGYRQEMYVPEETGFDPVSAVPEDKHVSLLEYRRKYASAGCRILLAFLSLAGYAMAVYTLLIDLYFGWWIILDLLLWPGLTLGMQLFKRKWCAVGLLIYTVLTGVAYGGLYGIVYFWWAIAAFVGTLFVFRTMDRQYSTYVISKSKWNYSFKK